LLFLSYLPADKRKNSVGISIEKQEYYFAITKGRDN